MKGPPPCSPSPAYARVFKAILSARIGTPAFRESLRQWREGFLSALAKPTLRFVIWIATRRCNLRCRYCVLPSERGLGPDLTTDEIKRVFAEMADDFDPARIMVGQ